MDAFNIIPCREIKQPVEEHEADFDRGRHYIRSDAMVSRLIEKRDENPVPVDYDLDSDDEALLEKISRGVEGTDSDDKLHVALSADALEVAIRSLEVESFEVMMSHVRVNTPFITQS